VTQLNIDSVETMAAERGLKMTPQRRAIIRFLESTNAHPTPDEVFAAVNVDFPMTSRATVYNTIAWLKEAGMLRELFTPDGVRLDPNFGEHHHFVCRVCNRIEDVGFDLVPNLGICALPNQNSIEEFEITIRGVCANCRAQLSIT